MFQIQICYQETTRWWRNDSLCAPNVATEIGECTMYHNPTKSIILATQNDYPAEDGRTRKANVYSCSSEIKPNRCAFTR